MARILFAFAIFSLKKAASSKLLSNFLLTFILEACLASGDFFVFFFDIFMQVKIKKFFG